MVISNHAYKTSGRNLLVETNLAEYVALGFFYVFIYKI